jgi:hypothetical protein
MDNQVSGQFTRQDAPWASRWSSYNRLPDQQRTHLNPIHSTYTPRRLPVMRPIPRHPGGHSDSPASKLVTMSR